MSKAMRRKYLINKVFQFRYMGMTIIPLVALLSAMYYLIYYCVLNQMLIPEAVAVTLLPAMRKVNIMIALVGPVLFLLISMKLLIYSNRIIGPIPRAEKELDRFIAGDHSVRISTRRKDELKSFVEKVNKVLEKSHQT
jgi:methyl-accepting chemotaxis protein